MSSVPENNRQDAGPSDGSEKKPHPNYGEYFRFRAIACAKDYYAYINHYKTSKGKRDHFASAGRRIWRRAARSVVVQLAAAIIAVGTVACWLYISDRLESDWVVAIFTVALTVTAIVQWWTAHRQWEAMREQNKIMLDQMKQTDALVKHSRLEQRAWLTIMDAKISDIKEGEPVKCSLKVFNSGHTPARITAGSIFFTVRNIAFSPTLLIEEFEGQGFQQNEQFIVPPGKDINVIVTDLDALSHEEFRSVKAHTSQLHTLCRFRYVDVFDEPHEAKAFYSLDLKDRGIYLRNDYGSMD